MARIQSQALPRGDARSGACDAPPDHRAIGQEPATRVSGIPVAAAMHAFNRKATGCFIPAIVVAMGLLLLAWVHFMH